jgi:hypothetical protein
VNSIVFGVDGLVSVAAENTIGTVLTRVLQSSSGYLRRHAEPARVQPVDEPGDGIAFEIEFLELKVQRRAQRVKPDIADLETVELMAVNRDVPPPVILPGIVLIDADAHQVRHDVGEPVIVIAFHPHDFDIALGI